MLEDKNIIFTRENQEDGVKFESTAKLAVSARADTALIESSNTFDFDTFMKDKLKLALYNQVYGDLRNPIYQLVNDYVRTGESKQELVDNLYRVLDKVHL